MLNWDVLWNTAGDELLSYGHVSNDCAIIVCGTEDMTHLDVLQLCSAWYGELWILIMMFI